MHDTTYNDIIYPDYDADELEKILVSLCKQNDYVLCDDLLAAVRSYLNDCTAKKNNNFSNGRFVRNIFDELVMNHAKRVVSIDNPSKDDLSILRTADFVVPEEKKNS